MRKKLTLEFHCLPLPLEPLIACVECNPCFVFSIRESNVNLMCLNHCQYRSNVDVQLSKACNLLNGLANYLRPCQHLPMYFLTDFHFEIVTDLCHTFDCCCSYKVMEYFSNNHRLDAVFSWDYDSQTLLDCVDYHLDSLKFLHRCLYDDFDFF